MKIYANAKINLSLDVSSKRDDGYHEVDMIMQEIDICDILDIELNESAEIVLHCDSDEIGDEKSNIAYKAAKLFFEKSNIDKGCTITLTKRIPVCAGLGGGSADAAAVLKGLNQLCGSPYDAISLASIGTLLGADVPFCVMGGTARATGIGEVLTPLSGIKNKWVVLIKPNISISTAEAYKKIDSTPYIHPDINMASHCIEQGNMEGLYAVAGNVFEYVTEAENPQIDQIKQYLISAGAEFAMMSGSGPTVFGVFNLEDTARRALDEYHGEYSGGGLAQFVTSLNDQH